MIKKIAAIFGLFMILTLILNVKQDIKYLVEEDDVIEWNAYEVTKFS